MKKRKINNLSLNKKTVSKLILEGNINGDGYISMFCPSGTPDCITKSHIFVCCPEQPAPEPAPTPYSDPAICTGGWGECPII